MDEKKLIWVDLETTGVDSDFNYLGIHKHKILEIGIHITDMNLNILDSGFEMVIGHDLDEAKGLACEYVLDMHEVNGLWERVANSPYSLLDVEYAAVQYLKANGIERISSPYCGNSVGFDRAFITAQMKGLSEYFSYRVLDVSSFAIIAKEFYPLVHEQVVKTNTHRALDDIKESINQMKLYKDLMMKDA